jgi:hypothetical protein
MWHFKMTDKPKFKQLIAREVLIFFSGLALVGLLWLFLIIRNYYYERKIINNQEEVASITSKMDSLPSDKIEALYDEIKQKLSVNYIVGVDSFTIIKKKESEFIKDYPNAKIQPVNISGYSYIKNKFKFDYLGAVKAGYTTEEIQEYLTRPPLPGMPKRPTPKLFNYYSNNLKEMKESGMSDTEINSFINQDSIFLFDFVALDKFKECLKNSYYKDKLYSTFSNDFDLGTKASYESKIEVGLKYTKEILEKKQKFSNDKKDAQSVIEKSKRNIFDKNRLAKILLWTSLIIGIIIYPLRLCFFAIKWSVRTVKKNAT